MGHPVILNYYLLLQIVHKKTPIFIIYLFIDLVGSWTVPAQQNSIATIAYLDNACK